MKILKFILPLLIFLMPGCKEGEIEHDNNETENTAPSTEPEYPDETENPEDTEFHLEILLPQADNDIKPGIMKTEWEENEAVTVLVRKNGEYSNYKFTKKKENSFYCDEFVPEDNIKYDYFILYPYNENVKSLVQTGDKLYTDTPITLSGETENKTVPVSCFGDMSALHNPVMYGMTSVEGTELPKISMNYAVSFCKFKLVNNSGTDLIIDRIEVGNSTGNYLGGTFILDMLSGKAQGKDSKARITIDIPGASLSSGATGDFYCIVRGIEFKENTNFNIYVTKKQTDASGKVSYVNSLSETGIWIKHKSYPFDLKNGHYYEFTADYSPKESELPTYPEPDEHPGQSIVFNANTAPWEMYRNSPDRRLFFVYPDNMKDGEKRPCIILFHGGGWTGGSLMQFACQAEEYAMKGYIAVLPEYRTTKTFGTTVADCVADGKSVIRYIRKNAEKLKIDSRYIAAGGGSAGGHIAAATALTEGFENDFDDKSVSCIPDALVLFNPVFNNAPSPEGYGYNMCKNFYPAISPAHNIKAGAPPTLVMVGTKDEFVSVSTVEKYRGNMEKVGARCDVEYYENQKHSFFNYKQRDHEKPESNFKKTINRSIQFLESLGWNKF